MGCGSSSSGDAVATGENPKASKGSPGIYFII